MIFVGKATIYLTFYNNSCRIIDILKSIRNTKKWVSVYFTTNNVYEPILPKCCATNYFGNYLNALILYIRYANL